LPTEKLLRKLLVNDDPRSEMPKIVHEIGRDLESKERCKFLKMANLLWKLAIGSKKELPDNQAVRFDRENMELFCWLEIEDCKFPPFGLGNLPARMIDLLDPSDDDQDKIVFFCLPSLERHTCSAQVDDWQREVPETFHCGYILFVSGPLAGATWFWSTNPKYVVDIREWIESREGGNRACASIYTNRSTGDDRAYTRGEMLTLNRRLVKQLIDWLLTAKWREFVPTT
jgi:hypothetical protein